MTPPRTSARPEPAGTEAAEPRVEPLSARWSHAFLAGGALVVLATSLSHGALRGWLLVGTAAAALGASAVVAQRRHDLLGPVSILRVALLLLVPGYVLWYPLGLDAELALVTISITDVLFIGGYLLYVAALARLIRRRGGSDRDRVVQVLDSLIISIGLAVLAWVFVISPVVRDPGFSGAAKVTAVSYPAIDVLLLGAVIRLLVQGRLTSVGDRLLTAWVCVQLAADLVYTVTSLRDTFSFDGPSPVLYTASFVLLGGAALHPSLALDPPAVPEPSLSAWRRLMLVGAASLIAPIVLVGLGVTGNVDDVATVALMSGVLFALALARIGILMVDVEQHRRIEDQLQASVRAERQRFIENRELLVSLRERQALSDRLFRIQRKISSRAPLQEVLDSITAGASDLLRDEVTGLRLIDPERPDILRLVSSVGVPAGTASELSQLTVGHGVGGRAVSEDRLCIQEDYTSWDGGLDPFRTRRLTAAMGAPVHVEGRPIGSLVVATFRPSRKYSLAEQDALVALAEHVSLALNDARTVQAMNEALDQALHQAMHDALTGLPNRACFYERTEQALQAARRDGTSTAVLLFDLDRFKEINDTLGHRYGDLVLQDIGPRISAQLRPGDTLARLGGDEFCVLLPHMTASAAALMARQIVAALEDPFEIDGMLLAVEASCGIVVAPEQGDTADLLLQRADVAMYLSKRSHGDPVVYSDEVDVNTPDRLALLGELRAAIGRDELCLHVQPQRDLVTAEVVGIEALVRWNHPRLGFLPPDRFIPIAEDTGLIRPLTAWVLSTALGHLRSWLDDPAVPLSSDAAIAVNVSTRSLLDDDFADEVTAALQRAGVPPERLILEVTETAIMADPERAHRLLTELAGTGVRIAIDDFGTGYSSLASLRFLPVHQLKIDKSFVTRMHEAPNDATIVRSIIDLGHTLGLTTVAEGVETEAAMDQLQRLGCDVAQGYFVARPMPTEAMADWVRHHRLEAAGSPYG